MIDAHQSSSCWARNTQSKVLLFKAVTDNYQLGERLSCKISKITIVETGCSCRDYKGTADGPHAGNTKLQLMYGTLT